MEEILVDQNGYKQYLDEIERLKEISHSNSVLGSKSYQDAIGDGWHDNFAFEEAMRESRTISKKIDNLLSQKKYLKIIEDTQKEEDLINIGDTVFIKINYSDSDYDEEKIKLTGNYIINTHDDINDISLNSPLGKALYKAKIGSTVTYFVEDKQIIVNIISKIT